MTRSKVFVSLLCILALYFASCEYEPEAINFKEVDPTGIQTIQIALNDIEDTLIVGTWTEVSFDLEFPKPVNFTLKVLLGTTTVYSGAQLSGAFTISPFEFANGIYPLIFEVVSSTGTLSLADRLDVEKVLFEYQGKIVHIETSPAQKLDIISITPQSDGLRITWPRYPKVNFTKYILHKVVSPIERGYSEYDQIEITDIRQTNFVDADFLGGNAEYKLQVVTFTDMAFSDPSSILIAPPAINYVHTNDLSSVEVAWPKSSFTSAFGSYHLLEDYTFGSHDYFTSANITDTLITLTDFPFGAAVRGELRTQPKVYEIDYATSGTYSTFADIYIGEKVPTEMKTLDVKSNDRIYYYRDGYLYAMRHSETKPYDSLAITLNFSAYADNSAAAMSPNGQYFYVTSEQNIIRLDAESLNEISSFAINDVVNQANTFPFAIAVNDNNRLVVDVRQQANHGVPIFFSTFLAIINGNNLTVSDTIHNSADVLSIHTNESQQYVAVNTVFDNKVFEISPAGLEIRRATLSNDVIARAVFTPGALHLIDNGFSKVYALSDFTQTSSTSHPLFDYRAILDPLTGNLGAYTAEDEYSIFEPVTMTLLHTIKINRYSGAPADFIQLMNNQLISRGGFRLSLP